MGGLGIAWCLQLVLDFVHGRSSLASLFKDLVLSAAGAIHQETGLFLITLIKFAISWGISVWRGKLVEKGDFNK